MDWTTIKIENELYILKYVNENTEKFIVYLSDFKALWFETISWVEIYKRAKSANTLINIEEKTIEQTLSSIADKYTFNSNDGRFQLKYYITGLPFHFSWTLAMCGPNVFYEEITKKLLVSLINLQHQRSDLIQVVKKKDSEINQYKIEGATLVRKIVATPTFVEQEFERKFRLKKDSRLFDLTKGINSNTNEIKNMCNYEKQIETDDKNTIPNTSNVPNGPSPSKNAKKSSKKEQDAMRKFQPKKEKKIIYENNSMEMESESDLEVVDNGNTMATSPIINDVESSQLPLPKRKLVRSKLNL